MYPQPEIMLILRLYSKGFHSGRITDSNEVLISSLFSPKGTLNYLIRFTLKSEVTSQPQIMLNASGTKTKQVIFVCFTYSLSDFKEV